MISVKWEKYIVKLGMNKKIIYFDIDKTLIDSNKLRELTRSGMCKELKLNREEINKIIDEYVNDLKYKNDFCREEMIKKISLKTGIKYSLLKNAHDKSIYYKKALYKEVIKTLIKLKKEGYQLGIYSEGFLKYQMDKLKLSGIYKYFDIEKINIERRKMDEKIVKKMDGATIIDDNIEVIKYLSNFSSIINIYINRIDGKKHNIFNTIFNLNEIN